MKNWYKESQEQKVLVVIRGVSGAGKSTLAQELGQDGVILSTDDYFYDSEGNYNFDPKKLSVAHKWNQDRTEEVMQNGAPLVVVDNTHVRFWESRKSVELAQKYGYEVKFAKPDWHSDLYDDQGKWNFDFLKGRNKHGVPDQALKRMIDNFEYDPSVEKILKSKAPWEKG
jgi:hypothetical protein